MTEGPALAEWLARWGYSSEADSLCLGVADIPNRHPYGRELNALLLPTGDIRAQAVFSVDGTPTVVFMGDENLPLSDYDIAALRKRLWNQNLATVLVEVRGDQATAYPANKVRAKPGESVDDKITLSFSQASPTGELSALDFATADVAVRHPSWFLADQKVDRTLIANTAVVVDELVKKGFANDGDEDVRRSGAQMLMGQLLFISYLEHRGIVSDVYRSRRSVHASIELIERRDRAGLERLIDSLKLDFNGDFLGDDRHDVWRWLNEAGFDVLARFLKRTEMSTGQGSFWNYDFSFIPVELLSGLYESFLNEHQKDKEGAVYTPRHLAVLAVDEALADEDLCSTKVFDGACGSGILLTTALRRIIIAHEQRLGRGTWLNERRDIVRAQIFGADINEMAGRVTAFSLYLSILEDLDPRDVLAAQEAHDSGLPELAGKNLICGPQDGDYFSRTHQFANRNFDIVISNPPWVEGDGNQQTTADIWAEGADLSIPRRQLAAAFTMRAMDFVRATGKVCLILPIPVFLGPTARRFVSTLLAYIKPLHLINFGDLQDLLFPMSANTCHVFVGRLRNPVDEIAVDEDFPYSVPKADISLTLGRLSVQTGDRHRLLTAEVSADNELLTNYMWGDENDVQLMSKLRSYGRLSHLLTDRSVTEENRWVSRKGVHLKDASRDYDDAKPLFSYPLFKPEYLNSGIPFVDGPPPSLWPSETHKVAGLNDEVLRVFDGPRVLFADGFDKNDLSPRAVFVEGKGAFTSSVGVIAGPVTDTDLIRFMAVYLRSTLVRYLLIMTNTKMLTERNAVHLFELKQLPFFRPEHAPNPDAASGALVRVATVMDELVTRSGLLLGASYKDRTAELDELVFDFFDLSLPERQLVRDTVEILLPVIRPRSMTRLLNQAADRVGTHDFRRYGEALLKSLQNWRTVSKGAGSFNVGVAMSDRGAPGALGVAEVSYSAQSGGDDKTAAAVNSDVPVFVYKQITAMVAKAEPMASRLQLLPTIDVWFDNKFYVVRNLQRRNWTARMALRDARRLVADVRRTAPPPETGPLLLKSSMLP